MTATQRATLSRSLLLHRRLLSRGVARASRTVIDNRSECLRCAGSGGRGTEGCRKEEGREKRVRLSRACVSAAVRFGSLLYTTRSPALSLLILTSSHHFLRYGVLHERYLFLDRRSRVERRTVPTVKKNTHANPAYARAHRHTEQRHGIAAFIAFQGLLALARGETRSPPGSPSALSSIFISYRSGGAATYGPVLTVLPHGYTV